MTLNKQACQSYYSPFLFRARERPCNGVTHSLQGCSVTFNIIQLNPDGSHHILPTSRCTLLTLYYTNTTLTLFCFKLSSSDSLSHNYLTRLKIKPKTNPCFWMRKHVPTSLPCVHWVIVKSLSSVLIGSLAVLPPSFISLIALWCVGVRRVYAFWFGLGVRPVYAFCCTGLTFLFTLLWMLQSRRRFHPYFPAPE